MEVRASYKQPEAGDISVDWEVKLLNQLVLFTNGKAHENYIKETGKYIVANSKFISSGGKVKKYSDYCLASAEYGSVLMVMSDVPNGKAIAKCFLVDKDNYYTVNQRVCSLKARADIPEFLFYAIDRNKYFLTFDDGVQQTNLRKGDILKCPVAIPPTLPEQAAIATALSDADSLIASLEKLVAKKRHIKQGTMQELLTGKKRLPGFGGEWEVKKLGDISKLYQPVTISAKQFSESGYPVYGANGIIGFYHDFNHDKWQVIITCRGSTCGTINRTVEKSWITGNAMVVNCDYSIGLCKEFLYYLLLNQDLSICITGTGQPQIVRGALLNFEIIFSSDLNEQTAIAQVLSDMDEEIEGLEQELAKYRLIKQGMMQELLTGKKRLI